MSTSQLTLDKAVEWRAPLWSSAVESGLSQAKLPSGSRVLELGYNSGLMSCYMNMAYGWKISGVEVSSEQKHLAQLNAKQFGIESNVEFHSCRPEETKDFPGQFDGVFVKSFLYHNKRLSDYKDWIKWIHEKLNKDGVFMAIENGKGHFIDRFYRNYLMRNCTWKDNTFYDQDIEDYMRSLFSRVTVQYFGGLSQYATGFPGLCSKLIEIEKKLNITGAQNCFIAAVVCKK